MYLTERLDLTSGVSSQAVLLLLSMYLSLRSYLPQHRILCIRYLRWKLVYRIDKRGKEEGRKDGLDMILLAACDGM